MGRVFDRYGGRGFWLMLVLTAFALAALLAGPNDDTMVPKKAAPIVKPQLLD